MADDVPLVVARVHLRLAQTFYLARMAELKDTIAAYESRFTSLVSEIQAIKSGDLDTSIQAELRAVLARKYGKRLLDSWVPPPEEVKSALESGPVTEMEPIEEKVQDVVFEGAQLGQTNTSGMRGSIAQSQEGLENIMEIDATKDDTERDREYRGWIEGPAVANQDAEKEREHLQTLQEERAEPGEEEQELEEELEAKEVALQLSIQEQSHAGTASSPPASLSSPPPALVDDIGHTVSTESSLHAEPVKSRLNRKVSKKKTSRGKSSKRKPKGEPHDAPESKRSKLREVSLATNRLRIQR